MAEDTPSHNARTRLQAVTRSAAGKASIKPPKALNIVHIALQGCLKVGSIEYGKTADTGGHLRYLLELVQALARLPQVEHQVVVTRAFSDAKFDGHYAAQREILSPGVELWRCWSDSKEYLPKEALWPELPALTHQLQCRLRQLSWQPTLTHAHYADAGWMAARIKQQLGIPYLFTAHSLGKVKAVTLQHRSPAENNSTECMAHLPRRIATEQYAIDHADLIIASSPDEVRRQYGLYEGQISHKCVINPPGCDLAVFGTAAPRPHLEWMSNEMQRFLQNPDKPALLAIARPVDKKNLAGLLRAYGECKQLSCRANLIIVAGVRVDLQQEDAEAAAIYRELLYLVDRYDLYGKVALPKKHTPEQVPAIYQWVAQRNGVFVNPALNEPFGLTLLEAAVAGLPVIATTDGGARDILARCRNGVVVNPRNGLAIAGAALTLLENHALWQTCSQQGKENSRYYAWARHAQQYVQDCEFVTLPANGVPERNTAGFMQALQRHVSGSDCHPATGDSVHA